MRIIVVLGFSFVFLSILANAEKQHYETYLPVVFRVEADSRFGVVQTGGGDASINALDLANYYNYGWGESIWKKQRMEMVARPSIPEIGLDAFIAAHPDRYWVIGNEPNVPNQDNLSPVAYAKLYHDWAERIRNISPTAKIINGGIVNWPDVSSALIYISRFREEHRKLYNIYPIVDVWSVHAYPPVGMDSDGRLHSVCDTAQPKRMVRDSVAYLRGIGESAPVWLTELGMDWSTDGDPCVALFMSEMVSWLKQTRLVDRWYWFSTNASTEGLGGNLVNADGTVTTLGRLYADLSRK